MKIQIVKKANAKTRSTDPARTWSKCPPKPRKITATSRRATGDIMKIQVLKRARQHPKHRIHAPISSRCRRRPRRNDPTRYTGALTAPVAQWRSASAWPLSAPERLPASLQSWRRCLPRPVAETLGTEGSADPLTVKIGTFVPKAAMPNRTKELIGLFTFEPLVAAAWDGRPPTGSPRRDRVRRSSGADRGPAPRRPLSHLRSDHRIGGPRPARRQAEVLRAGDRVDRGGRRSPAGARLHEPSTVRPEDLSTLIVDSNADDAPAAAPARLK